MPVLLWYMYSVAWVVLHTDILRAWHTFLHQTKAKNFCMGGYGMSRTTWDLKLSAKEFIKIMVQDILFMYVIFLEVLNVISWCNLNSKLMKKGLTRLPPIFALNMLTWQSYGTAGPGGGRLPYKSDRKLKVNRKGDQCGCGWCLNWPLKETTVPPPPPPPHWGCWQSADATFYQHLSVELFCLYRGERKLKHSVSSK